MYWSFFTNEFSYCSAFRDLNSLICYHTPTKEQPNQSLIIFCNMWGKYVCFKEFLLDYQKIFWLSNRKLFLPGWVYVFLSYFSRHNTNLRNFLRFEISWRCEIQAYKQDFSGSNVKTWLASRWHFQCAHQGLGDV